LEVEDWSSADIDHWYNEAIKLETAKYKAISDGLNGKKNE
jgi:hypothetical protein